MFTSTSPLTLMRAYVMTCVARFQCCHFPAISPSSQGLTTWSKINGLKIDERNMSFAKKRKVNQENRQFKTEWTDKYCFSLPDHANAKPTCLKHFYCLHAASFNGSFPETSEQRKQKIASMLTSYKRSVLTICKTASAQESTTAASLHVS